MPKTQPDRNARIIEAVANNTPISEVARTFGVSNTRIRQIATPKAVSAWRNANGDKPKAFQKLNERAMERETEFKVTVTADGKLAHEITTHRPLHEVRRILEDQLLSPLDKLLAKIASNRITDDLAESLLALMDGSATISRVPSRHRASTSEQANEPAEEDRLSGLTFGSAG